jgi:E3 ubiquitin-protein ligase makorin
VFPTPPPKAEVQLESASFTGDATESGGREAKQDIINNYLARLKTIPCRYFENSVKDQNEPSAFKPVCRFGNDCHYAHSHPITRQPYVFSSAELDAVKDKRLLNRRRARNRLAEQILTAEMMLWGLAALELEMTSDEEEDGYGSD